MVEFILSTVILFFLLAGIVQYTEHKTRSRIMVGKETHKHFDLADPNPRPDD